jgi:hypothetical protein
MWEPWENCRPLNDSHGTSDASHGRSQRMLVSFNLTALLQGGGVWVSLFLTEAVIGGEVTCSRLDCC